MLALAFPLFRINESLLFSIKSTQQNGFLLHATQFRNILKRKPMPCLTVQTNIADNQITDDFLKQVSAKVAQALGKPEQYVAVQISAGQKLFFGGTNQPAAVMELVSIGLPTNKTADISNQIMGLFEEKLNIKTDRIYLKFTNVAGNMMGWNKDTF